MKLGNKEPAPKTAKAEAWTDPDQAPARDTAWLDSRTEAELADLDEEFDDDRFLESYRFALCTQMVRPSQPGCFAQTLHLHSTAAGISRAACCHAR